MDHDFTSEEMLNDMLWTVTGCYAMIMQILSDLEDSLDDNTCRELETHIRLAIKSINSDWYDQLPDTKWSYRTKNAYIKAILTENFEMMKHHFDIRPE